MIYEKHADNILLSASPNATLTKFRLDSGAPILGVCISHTAHASSTTSYPAFYVYWTVPGVGEVLATVRNGTPSISGTDASLSEYNGLVLCKDLTASDGTMPSGRTLDVFPGATHVRLAPYQAVDGTNFGHVTIWLGRA